ncbi:MAG: helix-turn-helix transcriptional regulator [Chloroflexi bacterium]|nr:helix-turn-helix transcriptional regulator [Chloroflexota bacterium]
MPERRRGRPPHPDLLTPAERRVLEELRKGGTNAEIAVRIGIGPETVKTHVSNMLAKLELDDRQQLAAWREEDAPRRRWLLAPFLLRPLVAVGVVAGIAVVVVVILVLLALVRGDPEPLYIEGVGEIEGPVAVLLVEDIVDLTESEKAELDAELGMDHGHETRYRFRAAALDLGTGERWFLEGISDDLALAGTRLVAWTEDRIQLVALDGEVETVLFRADPTSSAFSDPIVSPDGSKIAFTLSPPAWRYVGDSVIVLDLRSGDEVLRVSQEDIGLEFQFVGALALRRWSRDGEALLVAYELRDEVRRIVLTLEGDSYVMPDNRDTQVWLSPDLRHAIHERVVRKTVPTDSGGDGKAVAVVEALTVVEISTERVLATITAEEGYTLVHGAGPLSGRYFYWMHPYYAFEGSASSQNALDLASDKVTGVPPNVNTALGREAYLEHWRAENANILANWGRCYESISALDACDVLVGAYRGVSFTRDQSTELRWELLGFIWLD